MESRVPVPTDNIYKFYALFGLLLFIFSCASMIYVTQSTNKLVFISLIELEDLKAIKQPSGTVQVKIEALERQLEIGQADKKFFSKVLNALIGVSIGISILGFFIWHYKVQPVLDETQRVQLEIYKLQLLKLQHELRIDGEDV